MGFTRFMAIGVIAITAVWPTPTVGQNVISPLPEPEISDDTWVLIEVWPLPAMPHISFSAYFLDFSYQKNRNLCEAAKRALDRDQRVALGRKSEEEHDSYRMCMALPEAIAEGYIEDRE